MKVPALVRRAGWNLGEQVVSSLTNSILSIIVAKSVDALTFGGFAVAFTVFALVIGASRAISTSPLNIRFADCTPEEGQRAAAAAAGNALVMGVIVGLGCVVAGLLLPAPLDQALIALGVVMPALLVQDAYRYVFFSNGRPQAAALASGLWAVLQIGSVIALLSFGLNAVGLLLLAWGLSAAAAAMLSIRQAGAWPAPRRALGWTREHLDLTRYKFATFVTAQGTTQGAILVIGVVATIATVGALRGTQILLGPASILALAALNFAVPELARRKARLTDRHWMLAALAVGGTVAVLALVWGSIFLLAPDVVGASLLEESWIGTREILFAAVITQVLSCMSIGPVAVIYALDRAHATLTIQIILGVLTFGCSVGGVFLGGALGAQWGFAIANAVVVPCWFYQLRRQLRMRAAEQPAEPTGDPVDTTVLPARKPMDIRFEDDFATSQLSTMLLPRIEPRDPPKPRPAPAPSAAPRPPDSRPQVPGPGPVHPPRPGGPGNGVPPRPAAGRGVGPGAPGQRPGPNTPGPTMPRPYGPGPNMPGPNMPGPNMPGPNMPGPNMPGPNMPGPNMPGPNMPGPNMPGPNMPGPNGPGPAVHGPNGRPGPNGPGPNGPRPAPPRPAPPRPGPAQRPGDGPRPDGPRPDADGARPGADGPRPGPGRPPLPPRPPMPPRPSAPRGQPGTQQPAPNGQPSPRPGPSPVPRNVNGPTNGATPDGPPPRSPRAPSPVPRNGHAPATQPAPGQGTSQPEGPSAPQEQPADAHRESPAPTNNGRTP